MIKGTRTIFSLAWAVGKQLLFRTIVSKLFRWNSRNSSLCSGTIVPEQLFRNRTILLPGTKHLANCFVPKEQKSIWNNCFVCFPTAQVCARCCVCCQLGTYNIFVNSRDISQYFRLCRVGRDWRRALPPLEADSREV